MKNLSLILFLCIVCFFSCKKENQTTIAQLQIPQLLDRPEKLKYFNEWSETRNQYADLKYKLSKDPEAIEALLQIANLYTSEARITGEHGHYYNAALAMINHALEVKTITKDQTFLALSAKAGVKLSLHSFDEALHLAQQAVLLNPYNAQIYGALVDAYVELGQYEKAIEMADKMVSIRPDLRSYSRVSYLREIYGSRKSGQ
jgi:pentatricopeptide repeat protein